MPEPTRQQYDICERTFSFSVRIVKLCRTLDRKDSSCRNLSRQLIKSGTSIGANLEEAQGGQSRADFIHKCSIARKEARETFYWLRLIVAADILPQPQMKQIIKECDEILAILTAIIKKSSRAPKA